MALTSGFWDSVNGDRQYSAAQFGELFDGLITDGIYQNVGSAFRVSSNSGISIKVGSGRAWFHHTWTNNTTEYPMDLALPDMLLSRIDAVVLEVDTRLAVRRNSLKVITGSLAANPVRPSLSTGDGCFQYPLAYVNVKANALNIQSSDITNMVGTSTTPYVSAKIPVNNPTEVLAQWQGMFDDWLDSLGMDTGTNNLVTVATQLQTLSPQVSTLKGQVADLKSLLQAMRSADAIA